MGSSKNGLGAAAKLLERKLSQSGKHGNAFPENGQRRKTFDNRDGHF